MSKQNKITFAMAFSVGAVLFSSHAGGGFATGNQANTYYVGLGWLGPAAAVLSMLLLTLTMRQAMVMYNSRRLTSTKQLFETLFHPFDKIEILFEVFFYIMVLMAIAAAISGAASALNNYFGLNYYVGIVAVGLIVMALTISGAASALNNYFGLNYYVGIVAVGLIVMALTIFGAGLVRSASTYMGIAILASAIAIYAIGIFKSEVSIGSLMAADFAETGFASLPKAITNAFVYAGFQCVTLPTLIACGTTMTSNKGCAKSMWISFVMNAVALALSVIMLLGWQDVYTSVEGGSTIPTLTSCVAMGATWLTVVYGTCLLLCLISTGVTITFAFVSRFENSFVYKNIESHTTRNAISAIFIIAVSMGISLMGLTNIIKYGYGYCGYLGIAVVVIPFLTVGVYKNRKYMKEHGEEFGAR